MKTKDVHTTLRSLILIASDGEMRVKKIPVEDLFDILRVQIKYMLFDKESLERELVKSRKR